MACTSIPITDDNRDESREDFEVNLETPSNVNEGDPNVATVTIVDDDGMRMFCLALYKCIFFSCVCMHVYIWKVPIPLVENSIG